MGSSFAICVQGPRTATSLVGLEGYQMDMFPKPIGEGQFSKAYECWRKDAPEERFALKVFIPDPFGAEHADNEIRTLRKLGEHPRIAQLVDVDVADPSTMRVILELCFGGQLYDRIEEKGGYEEPEAAIVAGQILEAVAFMHSKGVMHRDLKPENVLLARADSDVDVKVCDFGIAKVAEPPWRVPRARSFAGSDQYLAPEVIKQQEYGREVDIWALGVMVYALLSSTLPFLSEHADPEVRQLETYRSIVNRQLEFKGEVWKGKSTMAFDFINRMLTARQDLRPSAVQALHHPWPIRDRCNVVVPGAPLNQNFQSC